MNSISEQANATAGARANLNELLERQRTAFRAEGVVAYGTRIDRIERCIALLFIAGVGFMVDGFAERRTHPYTETLPAAAQMPMTDHER